MLLISFRLLRFSHVKMIYLYLHNNFHRYQLWAMHKSLLQTSRSSAKWPWCLCPMWMWPSGFRGQSSLWSCRLSHEWWFPYRWRKSKTKIKILEIREVRTINWKTANFELQNCSPYSICRSITIPDIVIHTGFSKKVGQFLTHLITGKNEFFFWMCFIKDVDISVLPSVWRCIIYYIYISLFLIPFSYLVTVSVRLMSKALSVMSASLDFTT